MGLFKNLRQFDNYSTSIDNSLNPDDVEEWDEFEELDFNKNTNRLEFILRHFTSKPRITRYVTRNYERTPIYEDISTSSRIIKRMNKVINPIKFTNEEILDLDIPYEDEVKIIETIGVTPKWLERDRDREDTKLAIRTEEKNYRNYDSEKKNYNYKFTDLPTTHGKFWLRLAFVPFTLGLSFIKYLTKKKAYENLVINTENEKWNKKHKKEIDAKNKSIKQEIEKNNSSVSIKIEKLNKKLNEIENRDVNKYYKKDEKGWIPLLEASAFGYPELEGLKGVYIIRNVTKEKYYVGQSKNLQKRMTDHFKKGQANEMKFAKDFFDGDEWTYRFIPLETKDQLDAEEKKWIEYYNSFNKGYNNTGGNY